MFQRLRDDIQCILERDPAARSAFEVLTCYPGLHALVLRWSARDARLREAALAYLRIQLQLGALQASPEHLQVGPAARLPAAFRSAACCTPSRGVAPCARVGLEQQRQSRHLPVRTA